MPVIVYKAVIGGLAVSLALGSSDVSALKLTLTKSNSYKNNLGMSDDAAFRAAVAASKRLHQSLDLAAATPKAHRYADENVAISGNDFIYTADDQRKPATVIVSHAEKYSLGTPSPTSSEIIKVSDEADQDIQGWEKLRKFTIAVTKGTDEPKQLKFLEYSTWLEFERDLVIMEGTNWETVVRAKGDIIQFSHFASRNANFPRLLPNANDEYIVHLSPYEMMFGMWIFDTRRTFYRVYRKDEKRFSTEFRPREMDLDTLMQYTKVTEDPRAMTTSQTASETLGVAEEADPNVSVVTPVRVSHQAEAVADVQASQPADVEEVNPRQVEEQMSLVGRLVPPPVAPSVERRGRRSSLDDGSGRYTVLPEAIYKQKKVEIMRRLNIMGNKSKSAEQKILKLGSAFVDPANALRLNLSRKLAVKPKFKILQMDRLVQPNQVVGVTA